MIADTMERFARKTCKKESKLSNKVYIKSWQRFSYQKHLTHQRFLPQTEAEKNYVVNNDDYKNPGWFNKPTKESIRALLTP